MHRQRHNLSNTMKKQGNWRPRKKMKSLQKPNLKVMEDCDLNDGEFRIIVMKKLSDIQGSEERQFNELRNKIDEQKRYSA